MLSLAYIRDNADAVRKAAEEKNASLDLDRLLALDGEVRGLKTRIDELRRQRNEISAGFKTADPAERPALGQRAKALGAEAGEVEAALEAKSAELEPTGINPCLATRSITWGVLTASAMPRLSVATTSSTVYGLTAGGPVCPPWKRRQKSSSERCPAVSWRMIVSTSSQSSWPSG